MLFACSSRLFFPTSAVFWWAAAQKVKNRAFPRDTPTAILSFLEQYLAS